MIFGRTLYTDDTYKLVGGVIPLLKMELHRVGYSDFYILTKVERHIWHNLSKRLEAEGNLHPSNRAYQRVAKGFIHHIVEERMETNKTALQFAHGDFMEQADTANWHASGYKHYPAINETPGAISFKSSLLALEYARRKLPCKVEVGAILPAVITEIRTNPHEPAIYSVLVAAEDELVAIPIAGSNVDGLKKEDFVGFQITQVADTPDAALPFLGTIQHKLKLAYHPVKGWLKEE